MQIFFMLLPIIGSVIILLFALIKGFDKTALALSASIAMVIAMFMLKNDASWYGIMMALTVPLAFSYLVICLFLSLREDREMKAKAEEIRNERKNRKKKK